MNIKLYDYGLPCGKVTISDLSSVNKLLENTNRLVELSSIYNYRFIFSSKKPKTENNTDMFKPFEVMKDLVPSNSIFSKYFAKWNKDIFTEQELEILKLMPSKFKDKVDGNNFFKSNFLLNYYYRQELKNDVSKSNYLQYILNIVATGNDILIVVPVNNLNLKTDIISNVIYILRINGVNVIINSDEKIYTKKK